jgi:spore photoproduct lyase
MSFNPVEVIRQLEYGTSPLDARIKALNEMCHAGYPVGLLIAPIVLLPDWKAYYGTLIEQLAEGLSEEVKRKGFIELILMTYSFVHNAINTEAFPQAVQPFDKALMKGRGRGKYAYHSELRQEAEAFFRDKLAHCLGSMPILYFS